MTISPLNVIQAILLLSTGRPLANAVSVLVGFTVGVGGVLAALVAVAGAVDLSGGSGHSSWSGILRLVLGAYLVIAAAGLPAG